MPYIISTEVKESSIEGAGKGVFTTVPIKKGDIIWSYDPNHCLQISEEQLLSLDKCSDDKHLLKEFLMFCYCEPTLEKIIFLCDESRFTNHSDTPNCGVVATNSVALRDINEGEEICEDYRTYGTMPKKIQDLLDKYGIWHI